MEKEQIRSRRTHPLAHAIIEIAFIIFLFYANLLMGEFTATHSRSKTILFAIHDIFTYTNFAIALISAVIGYFVFEFLRKRL